MNELQPYKQHQAFASLLFAAQTLLQISHQLRRALEDHRLILARKFDIPAAPIEGLASHRIDAFIG